VYRKRVALSVDHRVILTLNRKLASRLMPVQRFHGHFYNSKQHADSGKKPLGTLPILFMPLHAPLEIGDPPTIAITHQAGHLRFQYTQITQNLSFKFIHHAHPPDSIPNRR